MYRRLVLPVHLVVILLFLPSCSLLTRQSSVIPGSEVATVTVLPKDQSTQPPDIIPTEKNEVKPTPTTEATPSQEPARFGQLARQHLQALAGDIGPRIDGEESAFKAARYINQAFQKMGYEVQTQNFTFEDPETGETGDSSNVIALKEGQSDAVIVVGAHYDSVEEGTGADDNASGVAVMLETAEEIKDIQTPYAIEFVAFGSEEIDLDGSYYFVDQLSQRDLDNIVGMINLDSLISGNKTYVYGDVGSGSIHDWMIAEAKEDGFDLIGLPASALDYEDGTPCECADYAAFQEIGIPFAYFEATDWTQGDQDGQMQLDPQYGDNGVTWHTRYDTIEYIDKTFPHRIDDHFTLFISVLYNTLTQYQQ